MVKNNHHLTVYIALTLLFRRSLSLSVSVSAFAMTGTMLTLLWMAFMNSTSRGFKLNMKNMIESKEKDDCEAMRGNYFLYCCCVF